MCACCNIWMSAEFRGTYCLILFFSSYLLSICCVLELLCALENGRQQPIGKWGKEMK